MDTVTIKLTATAAERYGRTIRRARQILARECHPKDSLGIAARDVVYGELLEIADLLEGGTLDQEPERDVWQRPLQCDRCGRMGATRQGVAHSFCDGCYGWAHGVPAER